VKREREPEGETILSMLSLDHRGREKFRFWDPPFYQAGFARMVARAGEEARLGFKAHPQMLRHACGFALAAKGHDTRALQAYLGHKNIQHTVRRYTELSPTRFKSFWRV
jgi:site-specific recombinase XerD